MWIFYFWSTKKKKKLTNISLTKLALTLISTKIFPHLSGCTDCNTLPPPPPNRPLTTLSSHHSESGARAALFGMRVARGCAESEAVREGSATFCSVLNAAATSPKRTAFANQYTELSSPPVLQRAKTELSLNNPQSGFPIFSSFLTNHCQKVIMISNYSWFMY